MKKSTGKWIGLLGFIIGFGLGCEQVPAIHVIDGSSVAEHGVVEKRSLETIPSAQEIVSAAPVVGEARTETALPPMTPPPPAPPPPAVVTEEEPPATVEETPQQKVVTLGDRYSDESFLMHHAAQLCPLSCAGENEIVVGWKTRWVTKDSKRFPETVSLLCSTVTMDGISSASVETAAKCGERIPLETTVFPAGLAPFGVTQNPNDFRKVQTLVAPIHLGAAGTVEDPIINWSEKTFAAGLASEDVFTDDYRCRKGSVITGATYYEEGDHFLLAGITCREVRVSIGSE